MIRQYGALVYNLVGDGELRLLLITSKRTKRWIIPRGNPIRGLSPPKSAAQEAYEQAGVTGRVGNEEIGSYRYRKRQFFGWHVEAEVHVFPLRFTNQSDSWPEQDGRETRWFAQEEAAHAVQELGLKRLIRSFTPSRTA